MFERFTDRARKIMALANTEAQRFNHKYVGTEHILLAIVRENSNVAVSVLQRLDVDPRKVRLEVEKLIKSGPDLVTMGKLPQTAGTKRAIEAAIFEAQLLGHNYLGTEHLLLGLHHDGGVAGQVLSNLGLHLEELREEVRTLTGAKPSPAPAPATMSREKLIEKAAETAFAFTNPGYTLANADDETRAHCLRMAELQLDAIGVLPPKPAPVPEKTAGESLVHHWINCGSISGSDNIGKMAMDVDAEIAKVKVLIGEPPAGSHPDEANPRAETWHKERLNWIKEVDGLRTTLKLQAVAHHKQLESFRQRAAETIAKRFGLTVEESDGAKEILNLPLTTEEA